MTVTLLGLSRTCDLRDFPGVITVASWQQALADHAWAMWTEAEHLRTREPSLVHNWSGCAFLAPGPSAIYHYRGQRDNGREPEQVSAVFGLSVVDHTDAPVRFLTKAGTRLRRHGLLFLTMAFWNAQGEDVAKGHEYRARIYNAQSWKKLIREARYAGFDTFGGIDWRYHGNYLDDHSLASLVLTRR
jgi:hypothetical protein